MITLEDHLLDFHLTKPAAQSSGGQQNSLHVSSKVLQRLLLSGFLLSILCCLHAVGVIVRVIVEVTYKKKKLGWGKGFDQNEVTTVVQLDFNRLQLVLVTLTASGLTRLRQHSILSDVAGKCSVTCAYIFK